ncbi:MAG TPA: hypothetical protein VFI32_04085 [Rhodanobacteraceae bacterium]|nr:hypothetical protein [Rhodanobacteraceae bacterium]
MPNHRRNFYAIALLVCGAIAISASAQSSGGPYRIERSAIAGGGATLAGGAYRLSGTFGQAQSATLSASNCRFYNGFWAPVSDGIFANGFDSCL